MVWATEGSKTLTINENRRPAPKKSLSQGFHSLYGLSGHCIPRVLAWPVPFLVLH